MNTIAGMTVIALDAYKHIAILSLFHMSIHKRSQKMRIPTSQMITVGKDEGTTKVMPAS